MSPPRSSSTPPAPSPPGSTPPASAPACPSTAPPGLAAGFEDAVKTTVEALLSGHGTERVADIRAELQAEMTLNASVFRTDESLRAVSATIDALRDRYRSISVTDQSRRFNYELS